MNVSFRVMRYFAAAAHFKSLTKAAAELNISQSHFVKQGTVKRNFADGKRQGGAR